MIAVLHIVPDILDFIKCLKDIFAEIKIIPKRNSLSKKIKNRLPKNIFLDLTREDLKNKEVIRKNFSNENKTLIIDIGGYLLLMSFSNTTK